MAEKNLKRVEAAKARARSLSPEKRTEIARKAVTARWDKVKDIPQASYTGNLTIGDLCLPCAVLSDGTRVLTETDFMEGMGMYRSGALSIRREVDESGARMPLSLAFKNLKPYVERHLGAVHNITLNYRTEKGILANGIKAETIPKICDIWIDADEEIKLGSRQMQIAQRARVMMRALAHVGIISLVDEATGYQRDRTSNALAQILEAFIAKELQAWVKTFPDEYYEQLYRLRNLSFPSDRVKRPQYFGCLTNDIVYKRLAPGVL